VNVLELSANRMNRPANNLVKSVADRVSMPEVYVRIRSLINQPDSDIEDYVEVVRCDPVLAARVVKVANSSFFGYSRKTNSLEQAVSYIGVIQLHDVLLSILTIRSFAAIPNDIINLFEFWRVSVHCGVVSRILAEKCSLMASQRLFVSGMLHDIGHVLIYLKKPEAAQEAIMESIEQSIPLHLAERKLLGFDYIQAGIELMRLWHLPDSYEKTTEYHLQPGAAEQFQVEAAIVHLARHIVMRRDNDMPGAAGTEQVDPAVWNLTNLTQSVVDEVELEAPKYINEVLGLLLPVVG